MYNILIINYLYRRGIIDKDNYLIINTLHIIKFEYITVNITT